MEELHVIMVEGALASHLALPGKAFEDHFELERDLGLDALDLVLIALSFEDSVGVEFPIALLEPLVTVGQLKSLVRTWLTVVPALARAAVPARGARLRVASPLDLRPAAPSSSR